MHRAYAARGVLFLAVSLEPDAAEVRAAARRLGITMPIALARGEVLGPLGVRGIPSTVFVSRDGRIVIAASGYRSEGFLDARVQELLERGDR